MIPKQNNVVTKVQLIDEEAD